MHVVHAVTLGGLPHERFVFGVEAVDDLTALLSWPVGRKGSREGALTPGTKSWYIRAGEALGVAVLVERGGERTPHHSGLHVLKSQTGCLNGPGRVFERLSELGHCFVVLGNVMARYSSALIRPSDAKDCQRALKVSNMLTPPVLPRYLPSSSLQKFTNTSRPPGASSRARPSKMVSQSRCPWATKAASSVPDAPTGCT
jgi:hypothetical protein